MPERPDGPAVSRHHLFAPQRRRKCSLAGRHSPLPSCIGTATESRDDLSASGSSEVVDFCWSAAVLPPLSRSKHEGYFTSNRLRFSSKREPTPKRFRR